MQFRWILTLQTAYFSLKGAVASTDRGKKMLSFKGYISLNSQSTKYLYKSQSWLLLSLTSCSAV